ADTHHRSVYRDLSVTHDGRERPARDRDDCLRVDDADRRARKCLRIRQVVGVEQARRHVVAHRHDDAHVPKEHAHVAISERHYLRPRLSFLWIAGGFDSAAIDGTAAGATGLRHASTYSARPSDTSVRAV